MTPEASITASMKDHVIPGQAGKPRRKNLCDSGPIGSGATQDATDGHQSGRLPTINKRRGFEVKKVARNDVTIRGHRTISQA